MRRVSFNVAKAIKAAGYPQDETNSHYTYWGELVCYGIAGEMGYDVPTYLEVWLWLWREKRIAVEADYSLTRDEWINGGISGSGFADPEDAIVSAIDHLVEHNMIK